MTTTLIFLCLLCDCFSVYFLCYKSLHRTKIMWEYRVIDTQAASVTLGPGANFREQFENGLNELGNQGWELCCVSTTYPIFKRIRRD